MNESRGDEKSFFARPEHPARSQRAMEGSAPVSFDRAGTVGGRVTMQPELEEPGAS